MRGNGSQLALSMELRNKTAASDEVRACIAFVECASSHSKILSFTLCVCVFFARLLVSFVRPKPNAFNRNKWLHVYVCSCREQRKSEEQKITSYTEQNMVQPQDKYGGIRTNSSNNKDRLI